MSGLNNSAEALRDRFIVEQEYVRRYVDLLQRRTALNIWTVGGLLRLLERYGLGDGKPLQAGTSNFISGQGYSINYLHELSLKLLGLKPEIQKALEETQANYNSLDKHTDIDPDSSKVRALISECVELFETVYTENPTPARVEEVRKKHIAHLKEQEIFEDVPVFISDDFGSYDELVDYSIKYVNARTLETKLDDLYRALDLIEDLDILVRIARGDTEINVLRQGFITLSTIFDATVFDLMRVVPARDFFNLIHLFGKQDKIPLDRIGRYSSFDEFRDSIIEEQLKSKYLREILFILHAHRVILTDATQGDEFIHLLEMVLRRNIHIHNRGVVDGKYLETNEQGVPRYNVYNLTAGAVAHIDSTYWERANRLSLNCIRLITNWINSLPLSPATNP